MMHETGAVSFSGATSSSVADGEFQGASSNGVAKLRWQQRSKLLRVLRICEGNIFGETNEDGMRMIIFISLSFCRCFCCFLLFCFVPHGFRSCRLCLCKWLRQVSFSSWLYFFCPHVGVCRFDFLDFDPLLKTNMALDADCVLCI